MSAYGISSFASKNGGLQIWIGCVAGSQYIPCRQYPCRIINTCPESGEENMDDENNEHEGIRIVDKRRFTSEGEARPDEEMKEVRSEMRSEVSREAAEEPPRAQQASRSTPQPDEARTPEVDFSSFLMSLATQTFMFLGEVELPGGGAPEVNFEAAKQTIEIIGLLEEKTKGNLTPDEEKLLGDVLASVRMGYVTKSKEHKESR